MNLRLLLAGLAAGTATTFAALSRQRRIGAATVLIAAVWAALITRRSDGIESWSEELILGLIVVGLAGLGLARQLARRPSSWRVVVVGSAISVFGVFLGVPENVPSVVIGGVLLGIALVAASAKASLTAGAGAALAVVIGWTALSGAVGRPWATVGGAMCAGLAPWLAARDVFPRAPWARPAGWWLLVPHAVLVLAAARWIGVAPDATWVRVIVLAVAGAVTVSSARWRR